MPEVQPSGQSEVVIGVSNAKITFTKKLTTGWSKLLSIINLEISDKLKDYDVSNLYTENYNNINYYIDSNNAL